MNASLARQPTQLSGSSAPCHDEESGQAIKAKANVNANGGGGGDANRITGRPHANNAENTVPDSKYGQKSIVSSTNPVRRHKTGFKPATSYPSSYVGMPMNMTGITSVPPAERIAVQSQNCAKTCKDESANEG